MFNLVRKVGEIGKSKSADRRKWGKKVRQCRKFDKAKYLRKQENLSLEKDRYNGTCKLSNNIHNLRQNVLLAEPKKRETEESLLKGNQKRSSLIFYRITELAL